mmetsp:Transcript_28647/g.68302  ORF Transcript_28647/g.68302 Transcript_28647/m.68302 type:complete len:83 (-) Transcript_28647:121-369(-)
MSVVVSSCRVYAKIGASDGLLLRNILRAANVSVGFDADDDPRPCARSRRVDRRFKLLVTLDVTVTVAGLSNGGLNDSTAFKI